jgi:hypothetical protein
VVPAVESGIHMRGYAGSRSSAWTDDFDGRNPGPAMLCSRGGAEARGSAGKSDAVLPVPAVKGEETPDWSSVSSRTASAIFGNAGLNSRSHSASACVCTNFES